MREFEIAASTQHDITTASPTGEYTVVMSVSPWTSWQLHCYWRGLEDLTRIFCTTFKIFKYSSTCCTTELWLLSKSQSSSQHHFMFPRSWDKTQVVARLTHSLGQRLKDEVFPGGFIVSARGSCLLPCRLSVSVLSFTHSNFVSVLPCFPSWSPAGPATTEACWSETAQSLNVTGLKGFSWGEKAHIPLSVKRRSIVSAGPPSKQTWNYSISVCHMSSGAVQRRGGVLWWSM